LGPSRKLDPAEEERARKETRHEVCSFHRRRGCDALSARRKIARRAQVRSIIAPLFQPYAFG
jgi:hypothetical protein